MTTISITINWNSDDNGYNALKSGLFKFLMYNIQKGNNIIQTVPDEPFYVHRRSDLHLQAIGFDNYKKKTWEEIKCSDFNDWIKISPCEVSDNLKVYLKYKNTPYVGGFGTYLIQLLTGEITLQKHKEFVKILKLVFEDNPIIMHNLEVNWFHLKSYPKIEYSKKMNNKNKIKNKISKFLSSQPNKEEEKYSKKIFVLFLIDKINNLIENTMTYKNIISPDIKNYKSHNKYEIDKIYHFIENASATIERLKLKTKPEILNFIKKEKNKKNSTCS